MVLDYVLLPGHQTNLDTNRARPTVLAEDAGGDRFCFSLAYHSSPFLWAQALEV